MKRSLVKYCLLILSLVIFNVSAAGYKIKKGDVPPDYLGEDRQGNKVLVSEHKGKLVVISFWATWCGPCRRELPILDQLQDQLSDDILKVVAVNYKESKNAYKRNRSIKRVFRNSDVTLTNDKEGSIGKSYGVRGIPHLIIIGRNGRVVYQNRGYGDKTADKLASIINRLLKRKVKSNQLNQPPPAEPRV